MELTPPHLYARRRTLGLYFNQQVGWASQLVISKTMGISSFSREHRRNSVVMQMHVCFAERDKLHGIKNYVFCVSLYILHYDKKSYTRTFRMAVFCIILQTTVSCIVSKKIDGFDFPLK
jgi:hypothetical protein